MKNLVIIIVFLFLNILSANAQNPLLDAIKKNNFVQVKEEVKNGANVNYRDKNNATPLMWATYKSDLEMVKFLKNKGADCNLNGLVFYEKDTSIYYGSLMAIAAGENKFDILKYFVENCEISIEDCEYNPNSDKNDGWNALQWSSFMGNIDIVEYLIEKGANINANQSSDKGSPLIYSAMNKQYDVTKYLIEKGADINYIPVNKWSLIHYLARDEKNYLLELILKKGANPNLQTSQGYTPLILAAYNNHIETCMLLYNYGAKIDKKDNSGKTAKNYADEQNLISISSFLNSPDDFKLSEKGNVTYALKLYNSEEYEKAAPEFEKVIPDFEIQFGKNDTIYLTKILLLTAISYSKINQNKKATEFLLKGIKIYESLELADYQTYLSFLKYLHPIYDDNKEFDKEEEILIKEKELCAQVFGIDNKQYGTVLNDLGLLYTETKKYNRAETQLVKARNIYKKITGAESLDYVTTCTNLAKVYRYMLKYEESEELYLEALSILKIISYKKSNKYASCCENLANLYQDMQKYDKAKEYNNYAIKIYEENSGKNSLDYARICNNFGNLYNEIDNLDVAEEYYLESINIKEQIVGKNSNDYAIACDNIAGVYIKNQKLKKAEKLFIEAKNIRIKLFGKNSEDYALSCNNLATLYLGLGNYEKAELLLIEAKDIYENLYGKNNIYYATCCGNLGLVYENTNQNIKAEKLLIEAKSIRESILGKNNYRYANSCINLGTLYENMGKTDKAIELYSQASKIYKELFGENSLYFAYCCNNLAGVYSTKRNFKKAEKLYIKSRKIIDKTIGKNNIDYAERSSNLALLYFEKKEFNKAELIYTEENLILNNIILYTGTFMSTNEREDFIQNIVLRLYNKINLFYMYRNINKPEISTYVFNNTLLMKGLLLRSSLSMKNAVTNSNNQDLKNKYNQWIENSQRIINLDKIPLEKRHFDFDSLVEQTNILEKQLFSSNEFKNQQSLQNLTWQNVQDSLTKDEIVIEYINFTTDLTDTVLYYALLLSKEMKYPKMIYLCERNELDSIIIKDNINLSDYQHVKKIYDKTSPESKKLYNLIWKPIEPLIKNKKKLMISPAGLLNRVSFKAISTPDGKMLSDKYNIKYFTSSAKIILKPNLYINDLKKFVLFGDINYSPDTIAWKKKIAKFHKSNNFSVSRSYELNNLIGENRDISNSWSHLSATKDEVNQIDSLLNLKSLKSEKYTGINATEELFKYFDFSSPTAIHIATHGFYFPPEGTEGNIFLEGMDNIKYMYSSNPLDRSGIILAGANWTWGNANALPFAEDGILTANEISQMDMFNVKLVTLSACQTGLGDVKGSEGVFGLQRALKMAGVDFMIISLWKVPDEQTQQMMTYFYNYLISGDDIYSAFDKAQNDLKNLYRNIKGGMYAWAAFVLVY